MDSSCWNLGITDCNCLHIFILFPSVSVTVHVSTIFLFACLPACSSTHFSELLHFAGKKTLLLLRKRRNAFPVFVITMLFWHEDKHGPWWWSKTLWRRWQQSKHWERAHTSQNTDPANSRCCCMKVYHSALHRDCCLFVNPGGFDVCLFPFQLIYQEN